MVENVSKREPLYKDGVQRNAFRAPRTERSRLFKPPAPVVPESQKDRWGFFLPFIGYNEWVSLFFCLFTTSALIPPLF